MKLYVVTADTYTRDSLGIDIHLFGVYTEKEKAEQRKTSLENKFYFEAYITEISSDEDIDEYLGEYIE